MVKPPSARASLLAPHQSEPLSSTRACPPLASRPHPLLSQRTPTPVPPLLSARLCPLLLRVPPPPLPRAPGGRWRAGCPLLLSVPPVQREAAAASRSRRPLEGWVPSAAACATAAAGSTGGRRCLALQETTGGPGALCYCVCHRRRRFNGRPPLPRAPGGLRRAGCPLLQRVPPPQPGEREAAAASRSRSHRRAGCWLRFSPCCPLLQALSSWPSSIPSQTIPQIHQRTMKNEATQQQQLNVGSPGGAGSGGHVLADFGPREVTVRRCNEHDGLEAAEARQSLALRLDKDLPSSGSKNSAKEKRRKKNHHSNSTTNILPQSFLQQKCDGGQDVQEEMLNNTKKDNDLPLCESEEISQDSNNSTTNILPQRQTILS